VCDSCAVIANFRGFYIRVEGEPLGVCRTPRGVVLNTSGCQHGVSPCDMLTAYACKCPDAHPRHGSSSAAKTYTTEDVWHCNSCNSPLVQVVHEIGIYYSCCLGLQTAKRISKHQDR
jgi:hypothetical protein